MWDGLSRMSEGPCIGEYLGWNCLTWRELQGDFTYCKYSSSYVLNTDPASTYLYCTVVYMV
jgi:hypothetical protein